VRLCDIKKVKPRPIVVKKAIKSKEDIENAMRGAFTEEEIKDFVRLFSSENQAETKETTFQPSAEKREFIFNDTEKKEVEDEIAMNNIDLTQVCSKFGSRSGGVSKEACLQCGPLMSYFMHNVQHTNNFIDRKMVLFLNNTHYIKFMARQSRMMYDLSGKDHNLFLEIMKNMSKIFNSFQTSVAIGYVSPTRLHDIDQIKHFKCVDSYSADDAECRDILKKSKCQSNFGSFVYDGKEYPQFKDYYITTHGFFNAVGFTPYDASQSIGGLKKCGKNYIRFTGLRPGSLNHQNTAVISTKQI
jgi:hypothetical protein